MGSHASLKTSRTFWNCDRIGKSQSDLPKMCHCHFNYISQQLRKKVGLKLGCIFSFSPEATGMEFERTSLKCLMFHKILYQVGCGYNYLFLCMKLFRICFMKRILYFVSEHLDIYPL